MSTSVTFADMFNSDGKLAWFVVKMETVGSDRTAGGWWWGLGNGLMMQSSGYYGINVNDVQITQGNYDTNANSYYAGANVSATTVYVVEMRHDGSNVYIRVNNGTEGSTASVSSHSGADSGTWFLGKNWNASAFFDGYIAEVFTSDDVNDSADRDNMRYMLMNAYGASATS